MSLEQNTTLPAFAEAESTSSLFPFGHKLAAGRYAVTSQLHDGQLAHVYRATEIPSTEDVALKVFLENIYPNDPDKNAQLKNRVDNEIATHLLLNGLPGIVRLHDFGTLDEADGSLRYMATEYAQAGTLQDSLTNLQDGSVEITLAMAHQVAGALHAVHENGFIHRDIKPMNILHEAEDGWSLADFGLVEIQPDKVENHEITRKLGSLALYDKGKVCGTVGYIAPETLSSDETHDPAMDMFSLGVTLYRSATGEFPFPRVKSMDDASFMEYVHSVTQESPVPADIVNKQVPRPFSDLIDACLEKLPENRPTSAELQAELAVV
jgi:serine/threonine protein kinase